MISLSTLEALPLIKKLPISSREKQIVGATALISSAFLFGMGILLILLNLTSPLTGKDSQTESAPPRETENDSAEKTAKELRREDSLSSLAYTIAYPHLTARGEYRTAGRMLERLLKASPADTQYLKDMARILTALNQQNTAARYIDSLRKYCSRDTVNTLIVENSNPEELSRKIRNNAFLSELSGNIPALRAAAEKVYRKHPFLADTIAAKMLEEDSLRGTPFFFKAYALLKEDTSAVAQAVTLLKKSTARTPLYYRSHALLAQIYFTQEQHKKAEKEFRMALRLNGTDINLLYSFANFLFDAQNLREAAEYYQQIIAQEPDHWKSHYRIGLIFMEYDKYSTALDYFRDARSIAGERRDIMYQTAAAYEKSGAVEAALEVYNEILSRHPLDDIALYKKKILSKKN
ncbi:MAG: tetratricopeptide repeat protein [Fibrobacterota bacterium]